jgi:hypothetical protein
VVALLALLLVDSVANPWSPEFGQARRK